MDGWAWTNKDLFWNKKFKILKAFSQQFGHCDIPLTYMIKGESISFWLNKTRRAYVNGNLSSGQKFQLEQLNDW